MSLHEPHVFKPSTHNPRIRCCMKCGRMPEWYWHVEPEPPKTPSTVPRQIREMLKWLLGRSSDYTMSEDIERDAEAILDADLNSVDAALQ